MIWKLSDMERCHRFLHSWQHTEPVWSLAQTFWRWNSWTPHVSKHLEIKISWFHTSDISVHSSDQKLAYTYQIPTLFSKEHVASRSHPNNLVCGWDPLDPPKSKPSDPACLGHPTHFQPCYAYNQKIHKANVLAG